MGLLDMFKPPKQADNAQKETPTRKYYEYFSDSLSSIQASRLREYTYWFVIIMLLVMLSRSLNKPPLVIRVDSLGNAQAFTNVPSLQNVTPAEIANFTQYFLQYFTAHNFYTYDDDFTRAFKMMTPAATQKLNDYLGVHEIVDTIKSNQFRTKLTITDITTIKDSAAYINLKVKGTREIRSYQNAAYYREEYFEDELSIKKVDRTEATPWGLLVDSWSEALYKK